jgi:DUF438 domain-containing protein
MSEFPENKTQHLHNLEAYARGLAEGLNGKQLYNLHRADIASVTAMETMQVLDYLLTAGFEFERVKSITGKLINMFCKSLSSHEWQKPSPGHFLNYLMDENREVEKIMRALRAEVKNVFSTEGSPNPKTLAALRNHIAKLKLYELHYLKKENILFPYIEQIFPQYRCLQLMWSFHDDYRRGLKAIEKLLEAEELDRGTYKGTLEVSQDVTGIRELQGEQRLLEREA